MALAHRHRAARRRTSISAPLSVVFAVGVWLIATSGMTPAVALPTGPPVIQCNDVANVGATTTTCVVTITNNITYNADGTSTTASVIVTSVNGVENSTTAVVPITQIDQCNGSGAGGASTLTCTATITNNITGAPAGAAAISTIDQCNPVHGAPTTTCIATPAGPNATGGYQAIGQCNNSGDTGTMSCTATTGGATDTGPAVTIDQCNASGTTGASTVTCTATITNTYSCPGTTTTLANGACSAATTPTTDGTTPTTGGATPTTTDGTSGGTGATGGGSDDGGTGGTATGITVGSSANPSGSGESVDFTAVVTGPGGSTPTGSVMFFDGTRRLGTAPLIDGRATLTVSGLTIGDHDITARANGTNLTSATFRQTVGIGTAEAGSTSRQALSDLPRTGGAELFGFALGLLLLVGGMTVLTATSGRRTS